MPYNVGNYVRLKNHNNIFKVKGVDDEGVKIVMSIIEPSFDVYSRPENIEPILLDEKIVKDNFVKGEGNTYRLGNFTGRIWQHEEGWVIGTFSPDIIHAFTLIKYVHELQNVLALIKLDKKIKC